MLETEKIQRQKYSVATIALGAGLSLTLAGIIFQVLSSPCAIARCREIPRARQLALDSERIVLPSPSESRVVAANRQLAEAIDILDSIPRWSESYSEAANLLALYQPRSKSLKRQASALEKGEKAAAISRNPPMTLSELKESRTLWQSAISAWEGALADPEFSIFAAKKIQEYRKNLAFIEQHIIKERQAMVDLKTAKQTINAALVSLERARSFSSWQRVSLHWENALAQLQHIPQNTTAYEEARALSDICQARAIVARERQEAQAAALKAYDLAIDTARMAKEFESNREWSKAVFGWRSAINHLKQIPKNTFQYPQVRALMTPYTEALDRSQLELHRALRIDRARADLGKICSGEIKVCNYTFGNEGIRVYLTPAYSRYVWQSALESRSPENPRNRLQLLDHIDGLEQAFKTITKNAGIVLEVYNPERVLILTFAPKEEGGKI